MPAHTPEEIDRLFSEALNAGDLDALMTLYEPGAGFVAEPGGQAIIGTNAIRQALSEFVAIKPKITMEARNLCQVGDIAFISGRWSLSGTGPDGTPVNMTGQSAEVCRRQADGTWLFAIDLAHGTDWGT